MLPAHPMDGDAYREAKGACARKCQVDGIRHPYALDDRNVQIAYRRYRGFRILATGVSSVPDTLDFREVSPPFSLVRAI